MRDLGLLTMAEAVRKMTSTPATRFGCVDRGVIAPGRYADLGLFDAETIIDTGTWLDPTPPPARIVALWVNGTRTGDRTETTGARPGRTERGDPT